MGGDAPRSVPAGGVQTSRAPPCPPPGDPKPCPRACVVAMTAGIDAAPWCGPGSSAPGSCAPVPSSPRTPSSFLKQNLYRRSTIPHPPIIHAHRDWPSFVQRARACEWQASVTAWPEPRRRSALQQPAGTDVPSPRRGRHPRPQFYGPRPGAHPPRMHGSGSWRAASRQTTPRRPRHHHHQPPLSFSSPPSRQHRRQRPGMH